MIAQQSGAPPLIRINGKTFSAMIRASLTWLHTNHHTVNSLNVFPIPDGDTGTNMLLTMQAACDALEDTDSQSVAAIADILAEGALMGARGNSGVILSQILRGLARGLKIWKNATPGNSPKQCYVQQMTLTTAYYSQWKAQS